ncbi:iron-containing alcohol dehydrogenase [Paradesulfitobacterium aromaticivorans]
MNPDAIFSFTLPTKVLFGTNCLTQVGTEAKRLGARKVLVVTDEGIWKVGLAAPLLKYLEEVGLKYEVYYEVPEDPNTQVVNKGFQLLKETGCDLVVVIGGGSPICAGKGIALLATNGGVLTDYEGVEKVRISPLPVIAIPTTAGSGSEVSPSFIITDEARKNYKMTVTSNRCNPDVAILDPMIMRTLPARQCIISGMDALVHAIEATCTNLATPLTDSIAYEAIRLIMANLAKAAYSDDLDAKANQLLASTMANIACGNAKLGIVHAMSSPMGRYHLAHGLANGILLPYVMEYNMVAGAEKYARMAEVTGAAKPNMTTMEKARAAIDQVKELFEMVDFPDRLPPEIVPREEIPVMASIAMGRSQMKFNLRIPKEMEITQLFEQAFDGWLTH